ncbi:alternate-type signal peptide domain-containing protein [Gordonia sp. GONU]|uniref:alternate-type signal peptide domain-containing protein n=1 Tax=Gordonia TaxID=2053 RepID=UPI0021ACD9F8|nr:MULTISPECIES: alternate-type signal peptide domain-containing protein [Gordonia]MCR8898853.1 alternate-type signal peptide domain-containing protein [Gordonia sp. GONU]MCZ0913936.1 alternate-type signal peptide domain-containing protein [Gordonia amicalis]MCZ4650514.1 alternate-type signal peptide domain-containing protein [Gordonia amicalis]
MNRKTKGALAAGAGAVLLLGGVGSYALWSDTDTTAPGQITTGNLDLACGTTGTWTDVSTTMNGGTTINPASDFMVPGDVWEYTNTCTVTATGKNMKAQLNVTGIDAGPSSNFTVVTEVDGGQPNTPFDVNNGQAYDITVTVTFDEGTPGQVDTNTSVNVAAMAVSLNQVRP